MLRQPICRGDGLPWSPFTANRLHGLCKFYKRQRIHAHPCRPWFEPPCPQDGYTRGGAGSADVCHCLEQAVWVRLEPPTPIQSTSSINGGRLRSILRSTSSLPAPLGHQLDIGPSQ